MAQLVETGHDRVVHGVVRWRRIDLQRLIAERFGVVYHERTVGKILKQLGFSTSARADATRLRMGRPSRRSKTYGRPRPQAAFAR